MNVEKLEVIVLERDGRIMVKIVDINGKELQQVDEFKYSGTVVATEGGTMTAEIKDKGNMVQMER